MCRALCGGLGRVRQCDLLHGLVLRGTEFFIIAMAIGGLVINPWSINIWIDNHGPWMDGSCLYHRYVINICYNHQSMNLSVSLDSHGMGMDDT